ncbi:hypothetical protein JZ751_022038 [Albula glossodonta]|uniref:Inhibitor of growth protein N-terminal histone-binding domain-containing protein n=1 Tax=Albula glossodonta TaxID=121402 RepID=A0A8T2NR83_9TELE|nr:hypothetical protein JZ751_022038 [Albula glossodonta]
MATAIYLEHYLDKKKSEIDKLAAEYIENVRNLASEQRVEHLQKIQAAYSKCKEYSDDKVQLAMQTYEMVMGTVLLWYGHAALPCWLSFLCLNKASWLSVDCSHPQVDKHIRRLDADLARFENELKEKMEVSGYESPDGKSLKKSNRNLKDKKGPKGRGRKGSDEDSPREKKIKSSPEPGDSVLGVHPSDVLDMPVDPNEPTYCLCHQVSYGEMIGCDNPDVKEECSTLCQ